MNIIGVIEMDIIRQADGRIVQRFWMSNGCEYRVDYKPQSHDDIREE